MQRAFVLALAAAAVVCAVAVAAATIPAQQACQPPNDKFTFCDTSLSIEDRVADLISRMTLVEKAAQMGNTASGVSRLGLPHYEWWSEALHGVNSGCYNGPSGTRCMTSFPTAQNLAATFNMPLVSEVGVAISDEARAAYAVGVKENYPGWLFGPDVWTPNINIFRDPRWGRGQETPGEDPFLTARYGVAMIKALQESGDDKYWKLAATAKHFAAYSLEDYNGMDRYHFNANVTKQDLFQTFYPAFEAAVTEGNVHGIMCSYNAINGVPACADGNMLTELLRKTWKFDGYVTGDCTAVQYIWSAHGYTKTGPQTAKVALQAGTDSDCGGLYQQYMVQAVNQSLVSEKDVDLGLTHLYSVLMKLGVFDPWEDQPYASLDETQIDSAEHRAAARQSGSESLVLLKNEDNLLPLKADTATPLKVALIGPHISSTDNLCSEYHGNLPHVVSMQEAITKLKGVAATYTKGCDFTSTSTSGIAAAVAAAQAADVAIVAIGITPDQENEGRDRTTLVMPGVQDQLLAAVLAVQPNTVVVLVNGGMVAMETAVKAKAVIEAFYPGEEGGNSIADVLFGVYNPSGRLPVTLYSANFSKESDFYNYDMRKYPGLTYRFYQEKPIFEFGHGLSYTTFSYNIATATQTVPATLDASAVYKVTVKNTGKVAGDVSVLGFVSLASTSTHASHAAKHIRHRAGQRTLVDTNCPLKQLFGFEKVTLAAGQSTTLSFEITPADAFCVDTNGKRIARAGTYSVTLGDATAALIVK